MVVEVGCWEMRNWKLRNLAVKNPFKSAQFASSVFQSSRTGNTNSSADSFNSLILGDLQKSEKKYNLAVELFEKQQLKLFCKKAQKGLNKYEFVHNSSFLMKGGEDGFDEWAAANKQKWDSFVTWFTNNQLKIDNKHKFFSGQY